jgi:hypothetical protein
VLIKRVSRIAYGMVVEIAVLRVNPLVLGGFLPDQPDRFGPRGCADRISDRQRPIIETPAEVCHE